jgi:hypothetical protein
MTRFSFKQIKLKENAFKKKKLSDILKRGENEAKKESDDVTLFFLTTNAQHYTSFFNIFDKKSFVSFIFDLFAKTNKHTP